VLIQIGDSGVGIAEEDLSRIFEPFFSTGKKGTGLGLWVTHDIVRQHGGRIDVSSKKDRGTIFSIILQVESPLLNQDERSQVR
jgi:signal transduction histidine kinase